MSIQLVPCFSKCHKGSLQPLAPAGLINVLHQPKNLVLAIEGRVEGLRQAPMNLKNLQDKPGVSAAANGSS